MNEEWRSVTGYEGMYSVSSLGRVRSEDRLVLNRGFPSRRKGRILKPQMHPQGYPTVWICGRQRLIHHLVLESFVGPRPNGLWALHRDDNSHNNHITNLYYGTPSQNMQDLIRNGNHHYVNMTECRWGHELTPQNTITITRKDGIKYRNCRECQRKRSREYMRKKAAKSRTVQLNTANQHNETKRKVK